MVIALCFAGESPAFVVRPVARALPAAFSEARFLRSLPDDRMIAASDGPLAQLSRFRQMRQLVVPKDDRTAEFSWDLFVAMNATDRTGIPGHGAFEAERIVVDRASTWQRQLEAEMLRRGWSTELESPRRRFAVLRRSR
jgi:hypothetical protein